MGGMYPMFKLIKLLGAKSFDKICLRDIVTGKVLDTYSSMHSHPYGVCDKATIDYLTKKIGELKRKEQQVDEVLIELVRR